MIKFPPNPDPFPAPSLWSVTLYHCSVPGRDDPPREPPSASAWLRRTSPTSSRNTASRTATTAATRTATSLVSVPTSLTNIYLSRVQRAKVSRCSGFWLEVSQPEVNNDNIYIYPACVIDSTYNYAKLQTSERFEMK